MDFTAFRNRVRGMMMQPEATFLSDGQPAPPWAIVAREHVLPLILGSTVISALLQLVFFPAATASAGFLLLVVILHFVRNLILVFAMAYVATRLSAVWGGRRDLDSGFVLVALATTPMFLAGAIAPIPAFGWLVSIAGVVFTFVLVYRGASICLDIPNERRGFLVFALVVVDLVAGAILLWILGGLFGVELQLPS